MLSIAPWCVIAACRTHGCFQCDRIEGVPVVLGNKGTKEKYHMEQGTYKTKLTEHENTGQFWKGKGPLLELGMVHPHRRGTTVS